MPDSAVARKSAIIALTPGEPAGIGPDVCIMLAQQPPCRMVFIADPDMLSERASALKLPFRAPPWQGRETTTSAIAILPVKAPCTVSAGKLDRGNVPYVIETLEIAADGCLRGEFDALVTAPVHKGVINQAGVAFSGHTEFLATQSDTRQVVMMLVAERLRVALATTHIPLREVSRHITATHLEAVLRVLHHDLQHRFAIVQPRIAVCGLNPHAGESGYLGREEIEVIAPVLERLRREGMQLRGPVPADTAFTPPQLADVDAILAMYHDQGLPVLKHRGFGHAVNVTLGLPFIRTSVDHGTALALAGSARADPGSLRVAVDLALSLARR